MQEKLKKELIAKVKTLTDCYLTIEENGISFHYQASGYINENRETINWVLEKFKKASIKIHCGSNYPYFYVSFKNNLNNIMKNLVFIDNETKKENSHDLFYAKQFLKNVGILELFNNEIKEINDFGKKSKDEAMEILYDKNNIICTWSVYSIDRLNDTDSLKQLLSYLSAAGRSDVKDRTYICTSGQILEKLNRNIRESKDQIAILSAIETNYILTADFTDYKTTIKRLRVKINGYYDNCIVLENFNIKEL